MRKALSQTLPILTMQIMRVILASLLAVAAGAGVPHPAPDMPSGWQKHEDPVSADHVVELHLSLKQTNLDKLAGIAQLVSDPQSESYGGYLTDNELRSLTAPAAKDRRSVEKWLTSGMAQPIPFEEVGHNMLKVTTTASTAAALLKTSFHNIVNSETSQHVVHAGSYEIPTDVDSAIAAVYGVHGFPLPQTGPLKGQEAVAVTPAVISKTYGVSGVTASGSAKNNQAVAEFQGQTMNTSDLKKFFSEYVPKAPAGADVVNKFVPTNGAGYAGVEASLDIQYIMGVAPGVHTEFWYWANSDFCADLAKWSSQVLTTSDAPLVHSVSYGWQGDVKEIGCKSAQVTDIDTNFAKLAAKGITIIFASGDSGSGFSPMVLNNKSVTNLYPSWPASSPWVTSVGATRFQQQKVGQPEMATDQFGSGGGFSSMFDAFDAQKAAVAKYFTHATNLPPTGSYPPGGRATPDVAALGEGFQVLASGAVESVGGTSASTPLFAGLVSLLNEARLKAGKPTMGYLNPFLYQNADAFTDITVGTNAISRAGEKVPYGYDCAPGWDPATGLGTPIFSKLLSAALASKTSESIVV